MIKSMTGFASAAATAGNIAVTVEMRTYNSRNLDLSLRVSPGDPAFEERVRALLSGRLVRGRVEVKIQVETTVDDDARVEVDMTRARALMAVLKRLQADLGLDGPPLLGALDGLRRHFEKCGTGDGRRTRLAHPGDLSHQGSRRM